MIRRLREARDLIVWPLLTTAASCLPVRWAHWIRDNKEYEPEPVG